jgi:hypothetical protein
LAGRIGGQLCEENTDMTKEFSATFKLEKETKNTVRYAEEAEDPAAGRGDGVHRQI